MRPSDQIQLPAAAVPLPSVDLGIVLATPADRSRAPGQSRFETSGILQCPVSVTRDVNYVYAGVEKAPPVDGSAGPVHRWISADSRRKGSVDVQLCDVDMSVRGHPMLRRDTPVRTVVVTPELDLARVPTVCKPYVFPSFLLHVARAATADGVNGADQVQIATGALGDEPIMQLAGGTGLNDIDRFVSRFDLHGEHKGLLVRDIVEGPFAMQVASYAREVVHTTELSKKGDTREADYIMSQLHTDKAVERVVEEILTAYAKHLDGELYLEARGVQTDPSVIIERPNLYFDELGRLQSGNPAYSRGQIAAALESLPLGILLKGGKPESDVEVKNPDRLREYEVVVVPASAIVGTSVIAKMIRSAKYPLIAKPDPGFGGSYTRTLAGDGYVQRVTPKFAELQTARVIDFKPPTISQRFREHEFGRFTHSVSKFVLGVLPFAWFSSSVADQSADYVRPTAVAAAVLWFLSRPNRQPLVRTMGDPRVDRPAPAGPSSHDSYRTSEPYYAEQSSVEQERRQADTDFKSTTNSALDTGRDVDGDGVSS